MPPIPSTSSPLGLFVAPSSIGPPSPLLADNIDLNTRDFASLFTGYDPVDAAVITALGTARDSGASVQDFGLPAPPRKMDGTHELVIKSQVQLALRHLVSNKDIQLVSVESQIDDPSTQTFQIAVSYRNLRALDGKTRVQYARYPKG